MSRPNFETILSTISEWSAADVGMLCGSSRVPKVVIARGLMIVTAHEFAEMSYPEIRAAMVALRPSFLRSLRKPVKNNPRHSTQLTSANRTRAILLEADRLITEEASGGAL